MPGLSLWIGLTKLGNSEMCLLFDSVSENISD